MKTFVTHGLVPMWGRDPDEAHRPATPLELLYDLTFVVAFAAAGNQAAHFVAEGHWRTGLIGFAFAMFAVIWAWIGFTWFSSAYDTDDWLYRLLTMLQMIGALILALGVPAMFESIDAGEHVDNGVIVLGYVIMRVGLIALWLRAALQDPPRRAGALSYACTLLVAQVGWIALLLARTSVAVTLAVAVVLVAIEMFGPFLAERQRGGTPWHPHHIAERYGLLAIITLGEVILGTVAAIDAVVQSAGWSVETALVGLAGVGLAFGMWWMYFVMPYGVLLSRFRDRSFAWGYGHIIVFSSLAATGAALHASALYIEHEAHISELAVVVTTAAPVAAYIVCIYALYALLTRHIDRFHLWLLAASAVVLTIAITMAAATAPISACLLVVMLAPAVSVVGYEWIGHEHGEAVLLAFDTSDETGGHDQASSDVG